jgi:hypothetical protein
MGVKIEAWTNKKTGIVTNYVVHRDSKGHPIKGSRRQAVKTTKDYFWQHKMSENKVGIEEYKKNFMYRISCAINDVPVHDKYVSFLLQAFGSDSRQLEEKVYALKRLCVKLASEYLGYNYNVLDEWNGFTYFIAVQFPTEINFDARLIDRWFFFYEKEGFAKAQFKEGNLGSI